MARSREQLTAMAFIFLLITGLAGPASAQGRTQHMLKQCEGDLKAYCAGYIAGFYDGTVTSEALADKYSICPPVWKDSHMVSISYAQMIDVFVLWAKNQTRYRNVERWLGLRMALSDAFHCKDRPTGQKSESPNPPVPRQEAAGSATPTEPPARRIEPREDPE